MGGTNEEHKQQSTKCLCAWLNSGVPQPDRVVTGRRKTPQRVACVVVGCRLQAHHHEDVLKRYSAVLGTNHAQASILRDDTIIVGWLTNPLQEVIHLLLSAHLLSSVVRRPCPTIAMLCGIVGDALPGIVRCTPISTDHVVVIATTGDASTRRALQVECGGQHVRGGRDRLQPGREELLSLSKISTSICRRKMNVLVWTQKIIN